MILACRNIDDGIKAYEILKKERVKKIYIIKTNDILKKFFKSDIKIEVLDLNLTSLQSIKKFSDKINSRNM